MVNLFLPHNNTIELYSQTDFTNINVVFTNVLMFANINVMQIIKNAKELQKKKKKKTKE